MSKDRMIMLLLKENLESLETNVVDQDLQEHVCDWINIHILYYRVAGTGHIKCNDSIGLSKRHIAQTFQPLAVIIHLGTIGFHYPSTPKERRAVVRNSDALETVAMYTMSHLNQS
ncbi:hypothetical protein BU17DRAFT_102499 [Hysterangium stoloniferum]|nr:hypothetical protein BU17DRAFT_102499 [Hysterangium stoloniferum]